MATWVVTEAELDALAIHFACQGAVGAISILTAKGKPDKVAHEALSRCARILVALDADEDKADGSNPGAEAWLWWKKTYPQARLWPVPEGKDPGEAFALGITLADWVKAESPFLCARNASGSRESANFDVEHGRLGNTPKKSVVVEKEANGIECWPVAAGMSFAELPLPPSSEGHTSHFDLLRAFSKQSLNDPDCLLPCPKTDPPWWWVYYRDCIKRKCRGHADCMVGVLQSRIFQEALNAKKNISGQSVHD